MTVYQFFALLILDFILSVTFVVAAVVGVTLVRDALRARRISRAAKHDLPKVLAAAEKLLRR